MKIFISKNFNYDFLKIVSILCACLIPLLVTGPFLPDLLLSSLSIWFIYYTLKNKIYKVYKNTYFYFFIFFWLFCILSSLLSDHVFFSLKSSLFYVRIGIFALLISYIIDRYKKILDYFYYSFIITFSSLIIDGYFQYFTGLNLSGYPIQGIRVSSFFGHELILGSYFVRLFPLFFALFIIRPNKNNFEIYLISILFILIDVLIFLSGERASFILLNLSTLFVIFFISRYKLLRLGVFAISLSIIIFLTFKNDKLYDRYIIEPIDSFGINTEKFIIFTPVHDSLIKTSWQMFLDKPILGHGPKTFRFKCLDNKFNKKYDYCSTHPHNFYMQLLSETGIIGFLFLFLLFIYFIFLTCKHLFQYLKYKRKFMSDYQISLLSGLLITIWPFTSSGSIFTNYLMLIYGLQFGFFKKEKVS